MTWTYLYMWLGYIRKDTQKIHKKDCPWRVELKV